MITLHGYDSVFSVVRKHHFRWEEVKKGSECEEEFVGEVREYNCLSICRLLFFRREPHQTFEP